MDGSLWRGFGACDDVKSPDFLKTRVFLKNTGFFEKHGFFWVFWDEKNTAFLVIRVVIIKGEETQRFYVELRPYVVVTITPRQNLT